MRSTVYQLPSTSPTLLAIVGPTASGKSGLAMRVAKEFNGEIISADSRTIYEGMDIGTAKPTIEQQSEVKHWGLDMVEPGQQFSAAKFKTYAQRKIKDIQNRGKLPILVGGTGLYIDGVLFDFEFQPAAKPTERARLGILDTEQLQQIILKLKYPMPKNTQNRRHLMRTIERKGQTGNRRKRLSRGAFLIGLVPPDEILKQRIAKRAEEIFAGGVIGETEKLVNEYGNAAVSKTGGIVYGICLDVLSGKIDYGQAIERFKKEDWRYARRQRTWFRRNPHIQWFSSADSAFEHISKTLSN